MNDDALREIRHITEHKISFVPEDKDYIPNFLIEEPVFLFHKRTTYEELKTISYQYVHKSSSAIRQTVLNCPKGPLNQNDFSVLLALLRMLIENNSDKKEGLYERTKGKLKTTFKAVCQEMGIYKNGTNFKMIRESLERMTYTTIRREVMTPKEVYIEKQFISTYAWESVSTDEHLINFLRVDTEHYTGGSTPLDLIVEINTNLVQAIEKDDAVYSSRDYRKLLANPIAYKVYLILNKWQAYKNDRTKYDIDVLLNRIPIYGGDHLSGSGSIDKAELVKREREKKRKLNSSLDALVDVGFIKNFGVSKDTIWVDFVDVGFQDQSVKILHRGLQGVFTFASTVGISHEDVIKAIVQPQDLTNMLAFINYLDLKNPEVPVNDPLEVQKKVKKEMFLQYFIDPKPLLEKVPEVYFENEQLK